jgi:competence protein ComEC
MSELAAVVLALATAGGALLAVPLPLPPAMALAVVGLVVRRPALVMVAAALAASALAARAEHGLRPPVLGRWQGVTTLVGDPSEVAGALRVDVRIDGKRVEAWARGRAAANLRNRLAGERVVIAGDVQPVPADAQSRLGRRHVGARMSVTTAALSSAGGPVTRLANGLRRTLLGGAEVLPPERRALFAGFVLGDDRDQPPEVTDDFRAAGLSHLLVVSGQNVAFVLALAGPVLRRLGLSGRAAAGMAVLLLFGVVTRWEPSVLRAEAMAAISLLATAMGRPVSTLRLLALAVAGLLLVDPLLIRSIGFLLSVGACTGIAVLAPRITARLPGPRWLATALGVTLAAQVGVLPVMVPVFAQVPVAALPANLVAVPVAGPLMMWGMAAGLLAGVVGGTAASALHAPTNVMIAWVAGVARVAAAAPLGQLHLAHVVALAGVVAFAAVCLHRGWRAGAAAAGVAGLAVLGAPAVAVVRQAPVDGRAVAEGARLWRRAGASVLVVDDLRASPARLLSGLRAADVRRLDVLVVTGAGAAAARDVVPVLRRYPPRLVLAPVPQRLGPQATTPSAGSRVVAGPLSIDVASTGPPLSVTVGRQRAPPGSVGPAAGASR